MISKLPKNLKIIIICFSIFMCFLIIVKIINDNSSENILKEKKSELYNLIDKSTFVNTSKYTIYGTHFNIEGTIDIVKISGIKVNYVDLCLRDLDGNEYTVKSSFNTQDNFVSFSTTETINNGLDLETLPINNYYVFLKVTFSNSDVKYYSLKNSSEYKDLTYYTITKNQSNNKIDITFNQDENLQYMNFNVTQVSSLPDDVYDIAIDPGHGGKDKGAKSKDHTEAEIALKCGLDLKSKLENLGYKVFISRDGTESEDEDTANNMYSENGRVNILNKSKSKLLLSIHLNENIYSKKTGGVEIYAPSNCNLDFASKIAENIVNMANTHYSELKSFKASDGIYVRNFNNADILAFNSRAKKNNYEPYNITTSTPYLYIIRETGGISTGAFVDGRNKSYGKNNYYNSNIGIESYQIELGYMKIEDDLNNIINNYTKYMDAIVKSIQEKYK